MLPSNWGRRWITIDTSRVALALASARIMGARYSYYLLVDSRDGQLKETEITRKAPPEAPTQNNIRQGFVYERVPHITLKSIANNVEIDVIWEKFQKTLEPLREQLNKALKQNLEEWEIPRDADNKWSNEAKKLHSEWWEHRIARHTMLDGWIVCIRMYFLYLITSATSPLHYTSITRPSAPIPAVYYSHPVWLKIQSLLWRDQIHILQFS
jgi:adenine-specific DNA-methyltransferase